MISPNTPIDRATRQRLWIIILGVFAPALDSTIVSIALHRITATWHAPLATTQWVLTAYLLAMTLAMPLTGWASARFGSKRLWLISLGLFLGGSVLAGLSWSLGVLIACRILQGVAGGFMLPITMNLMVESVDRRQLGPLMATVTLPLLVVPILGPVIGGLIVSHISWRWIFYVNVPICLSAIGSAWWLLPSSAPATLTPFLDVWGLIWLSPALAGLFYGVSRMGNAPLGWMTILPLLVGILCVALYIVHASRRTGVPLIDIRLLRIRSFSAAIFIQFMFGFSLFGSLLILPLFYQDVRHQTALMAGLLLAPQGIGALAARWVVGPAIERIGIRNWGFIGVAATALGTLAFAQSGVHTPEWLLGASLILRGAGLSTMVIAVSVGVYRDLPANALASATSMSEILQQLGGALGAEVLALILAHSLRGVAAADTVRAYDQTLWWAMGFLSLILIPTLWLPRQHHSQ